MKSPNKLIQIVLRTGLKPIPKTSVSEWADNYRMLSGGAEPGRWHTDRAPYQRKIMDAFTEPGIRKVVVKSASQIGKSDIMNNVIGRFAHLDPTQIMMIQPTIDMGEDFSKSRIAPMIRDTKVLKNLFYNIKTKKTIKTRETNNTILSKFFPGGRLIISGANSPTGLASRPIRIMLADEVDRYNDSAGTEGDPIDLALKRMTTFWNRIAGMFSSPKEEECSRINTEYMAGTQEEWQHECPNCKEYHLITYRDIISEHTETKNRDGSKCVFVDFVKYRCPDCGMEFSEAEMKSANQKYVANNIIALKNGARSFFVNCFAVPWISWNEVITEWLQAKGDPEREKVVVNTRFGETYKIRGEFEDENIFLDRREKYFADLPEGVLLLTAAVDTQDNRLEYEIVGWGEGEECWGIKKGTILGVPDTKQVWRELDHQIDRTYYFKNGIGLNVARTFIDSGGHYTEEVYRYCKNNMTKQRFAIKGVSGFGLSIIHKYSKAEAKIGKRIHTIPLVLLGVDNGKQYVMERLAIMHKGPKCFHFPLDEKEDNITDALQRRGYDQTYFKGLISEQLQPIKSKGRIRMAWVNIAKDKRNEPLDLRTYNIAVLKSLEVNWEELKILIGGTKTIAKAQPPKKKTWKKRTNLF